MSVHRVSIRKRFVCLGLDGTRKTRELDNFQRDWPNIIVADEATIAAVDRKMGAVGHRSPAFSFAEIQAPGVWKEAVVNDQSYGEEAVVS
jgi:hypothetical protein